MSKTREELVKAVEDARAARDAAGDAWTAVWSAAWDAENSAWAARDDYINAVDVLDAYDKEST